MFKRMDLSERLDIIEVLRFCAAMAVVFRHIPVIEKGDFGVDIFFVISGFVMMLSTEKSTSQFFTKRVIRIVPTYWICTLGVFSIALLAPSLLNNTTVDLAQLVKSLFFIPFDKNGTGHWPVLPLGWTLNYEMFFYLLFSITLLVTHRNRGVLVVLLISLMMLPARITDNFAFSVYGNLMVLEFALGVLAYMLLAERSAYRILTVAFFIVVSALFHNASTGHRFYAFGLPAFALVTVCVYFLSNVRMPSFLVMLGGASYALYLTHLYIIRIFVKLTDWFDGTATEQVMATVISIVIVNVLALAFYKFLEIPINRFLRRRLLVRPHKTDLNNGLNTAP